MSNRNYIAGRNYEYEVKKGFEKVGAKVIRASGSHGEFDLVVYHEDPNKKVRLVQCKLLSKWSDINPILKEFTKKYKPHPHYIHMLVYRVKGDKSTYKATGI